MDICNLFVYGTLMSGYRYCDRRFAVEKGVPVSSGDWRLYMTSEKHE